jgi:hypothetical protein
MQNHNQNQQHSSAAPVEHQSDAHTSFLPDIDASLANLTPDQAMILQQIQTLGMLQGYARPTIKRRKPVKWEAWEEKNLIDGVRRVS